MGSLGSGFSAQTVPGNLGRQAGDEQQAKKKRCGSYFQMPLHYPRYTKADYENMPEWKLDCLLTEYGLPLMGDVNGKRKFAMGTFLWTSSHKKP